jgi:hypothetical protein
MLEFFTAFLLFNSLMSEISSETGASAAQQTLFYQSFAWLNIMQSGRAHAIDAHEIRAWQTDMKFATLSFNLLE